MAHRTRADFLNGNILINAHKTNSYTEIILRVRDISTPTTVYQAAPGNRRGSSRRPIKLGPTSSFSSCSVDYEIRRSLYYLFILTPAPPLPRNRRTTPQRSFHPRKNINFTASSVARVEILRLCETRVDGTNWTLV